MKLIIFDMDGVLVNISESYLLAIKKTAEFFLGKMLEMDVVHEIKNRGINNEHEATRILIEEQGGWVKERFLIKKFQEYYKGKEYQGLIQNETALIKDEILKGIDAKRAIFTGRPKDECDFAIKAFKWEGVFDPIITCEDAEPKPSGDGIKKILEQTSIDKSDCIYVGDNPADLKAAKEADVKFIAITNNPELFEGADHIFPDVNDILKVFE